MVSGSNGLEELSQAFSQLLGRFLIIAAAVSGSRESAEDIVQDAAMAAVRNWSRYTPGTHLSAWLAEIVRRCASNHRRNTARRKTLPTDPAILSRITRPVEAAALPHLEDVNESRRGDEHWQTVFDDHVWNALQRLRPEARCCLMLRVVYQVSFAEIAVMLKIPTGTAMSHVHRSREKLREELADFYPRASGNVEAAKSTNFQA